MTYQVGKKPVLCIDSILIKRKDRTDETLIENVGRKSRNPPEHVEAGTRLENEEGGHLLKEQADHDGAPLDVRPVLRRNPKAKLKHDETEDGNRAVTIFRTLVRPTRVSKWILRGHLPSQKKRGVKQKPYVFKLKTKRGAQNDSE